MISKWLHLKDKAIALRKSGYSIRDVEIELVIPRSTLSWWFRHIVLDKKHQKALKLRYDKALVTARKGSVIWHNKQKKLRLEQAEAEAEQILSRVNIQDTASIELALAMLYLGEGSKSGGTGIGNSDPLILKFFLKVMIHLYGLDVNKIRFDLHLRYDQNPIKMKKWWSEELCVPIERFKYVSKDIRTKGRKTYQTYKGVCLIDCGNIAIQRKLVYLSRKFCEKIITDYMRA